MATGKGIWPGTEASTARLWSIKWTPIDIGRITSNAKISPTYLEGSGSARLPQALPGQFLVIRLRTTPEGPMLLRNYSMSGMPGADVYRISVKREAHGVV